MRWHLTVSETSNAVFRIQGGSNFLASLSGCSPKLSEKEIPDDHEYFWYWADIFLVYRYVVEIHGGNTLADFPVLRANFEPSANKQVV